MPATRNVPTLVTTWVLSLSLMLQPTNALSWGLKTHVWIGQQVLNDALNDGQLEIAGKRYPLPPHILDALRAYPDRYLMGNLGPDVFPDPIVGQTTIHPGVKGGWQTDEWLKHLLSNASGAEETAFAYGFVSHASGDIFAHTYVNAYAGDIFELTSTDSGREVERRHFLLEKYIEALTPRSRNLAGKAISIQTDLSTATSYARSQLIASRDVAGQYSRVSSATHLNAMYEVRRAVENVERELGVVIGQLTKWGAKLLKEQVKLTADLTSAKYAVDLAEQAVKAEEEVLKLKETAVDFAKKRLSEARDIVDKNPELINANESVLIAQTKLAADAVAESAKVAAEINRKINELNLAIENAGASIAKLACYLLVWPSAVRECKDNVNKLQNTITSLRQQLTLERERQRLSDNAATELSVARDKTKAELDRLKNSLDTATRGLADLSYEGAVVVANAELAVQRGLLEQKQKAVRETRKVQEKVAAELEKNAPLVDQFKKAVDRYNPLTLLLKNWLDDIDIATEEYIKASHRAGVIMATNSGNVLSEYNHWFSCYGQVFVSQPRQLGQAQCLGKKYLENINNEIDKVIDDLPEIVRWIVFPTREVKKKATKLVKPELEKAALSITAFVTDPTTADFLSLLIDPDNATREKLNEAFQGDSSRLKLMRFDDVASLIDQDLKITEGKLDPRKFLPLAHSLTLAKLALLGPDQLNQLVSDLAGPFTSPRYGSPLYVSALPNFSILFDVVRSIDGNHQWQAYGLPAPRRKGVSHASPHSSHYGHDYYSDNSKGLKLWVDPFLREKVFLKLFPGSVLGALGMRAELQKPAYRFPACAGNMYPATQANDGIVLAADLTCDGLTNPNAGAPVRAFTTHDDYVRRFYTCSLPASGLSSTIVASPATAAQARKTALYLQQQFPDMHFEIKAPVRHSRYSAIIAARCADKNVANEARELAVTRGIARDAFVVTSRNR